MRESVHSEIKVNTSSDASVVWNVLAVLHLDIFVLWLECWPTRPTRISKLLFQLLKAMCPVKGMLQ